MRRTVMRAVMRDDQGDRQVSAEPGPAFPAVPRRDPGTPGPRDTVSRRRSSFR